ncbi:MAG: kelch repeat-containing protein [Candidatus Nanopelagicales bacterium]
MCSLRWSLRRGVCSVVGAFLALSFASGCTTSPVSSSIPRETSPTTSFPTGGLTLSTPRAVHQATRLTDGRVLFTGGCSSSGCGGVEQAGVSDLYDPATGQLEAGPMMVVPRLSHTATLLDDGRVLVVGGYVGEGAPPTSSIEVFDPTTEAFTALGSLQKARADHTATLLRDGRVVIAGGRGVNGAALDSVEIIDPKTGAVVAGPDLPKPRTAQVATTFAADVLLIGGTTVNDRAVASTVRLDLRAWRWIAGPTLETARVKHTAVSLPDGDVLVIGGSGSAESRDAFASTELLRRGSDRFRAGPLLPEGRYKLTNAAAVLPDGRVAVAGGTLLAIIDTDSASVERIESPSLDGERAFQTLTVLPDGKALVAGGYDAHIVPTAAAWVVPIP